MSENEPDYKLQKFEIIIGTAIPLDTWLFNQEKNERALKREIESLLRRFGLSESNYIEFEAGEPFE